MNSSDSQMTTKVLGDVALRAPHYPALPDAPVFTSAFQSYLNGVIVAFGSCRSSQHETNEDCVRIDLRKMLFGVSDGISKGVDGHVASERALIALFENRIALTHESALERFSDANRAVANALMGQGGATAVVARLVGSHLYVYNVGDCRAYLLRRSLFSRPSTIEQVTSDHVIREGTQAQSSSLDSDNQSKLAQAIGYWVFEVGRHKRTLRSGDVVLLCSDGVYKTGALDAVFATLSAHRKMTLNNLKELCRSVAVESAQCGDDSSVLMFQYFGYVHVRHGLWLTFAIAVFIFFFSTLVVI